MKAMLAIVLAASLHAAFAGNPKRSRAEAPSGAEAGNTIGRGNIWISFGLRTSSVTTPVRGEDILALVEPEFRGDLARAYDTSGRYSRELRMVPELSAYVGLTDQLQFGVEGTPWDGHKIGSTSARFKATLPGNDNLRLFNAAGGVEFTLSTEEDVRNPERTAPVYRPVASFFADVDWDLIKISPAWPLKLYAGYGTLDERRLAQIYKQRSLRLAVEHKDFRRSLWMKSVATHYVSRIRTLGPDSEKAGEWVFQLALGGRWRPHDFWSLSADFSFDPVRPLDFMRQEYGKSPALLVRVELPLRYQETKSEAIRALHYHERNGQAMAKAAKTDAKKQGERRAELDGLDEIVRREIRMGRLDESFVKEALGAAPDSARLEKRKRIRDELREIEGLLE